MITWTPIAQLPDELKDGRRFLVADECGDADFARWHKDHICGEYEGIGTFTHFAEITPPEETARTAFEAFCHKEGLALDDPAAQLRYLTEHGQQWLPSEAEITPPDEPVQQFTYVRDPANPEAPSMEIPWGEMTVGTKFTVQDWPKPGCNRFEVVDGVPPLKSQPLP